MPPVINRNYGFDAAARWQNIDGFMEPYTVPQQNGNRTGLCWMLPADRRNRGLPVAAGSLLNISAWPVAAPLEQYQIPAASYRYSFYLVPAKGNSTPMIQLSKNIKS